MAAVFPGGSIALILTFLALPFLAMSVNSRSEVLGQIQFVVCLGAILLIIIAAFLWLIVAFGSDLEAARKAHNERLETEILTLRLIGLPVIITLYILYRCANSFWYSMGPGGALCDNSYHCRATTSNALLHGVACCHPRCSSCISGNDGPRWDLSSAGCPCQHQ